MAYVVLTVRPRDASRGTYDPQAYRGRVEHDVAVYPRDAGRGTYDVQLRPAVRRAPQAAGGPAFPTQYGFLKIQKGGSALVLCAVATADAPAGMGGQLRIHKGGTTYALYLVETTDPDASPVRVRTSAGTKAIRLKT